MAQITDIKESINTAVDTIESQKDSNHTLDETDFALALALEFPELMNKKQRYSNIKFGGCYIHPHQMANVVANGFPNPYCKLGDLLVLVRKHFRYNAALIQFVLINKNDTNPIVIKNQFHQGTSSLYRQWPLFNLASSNRNPYDIYPKTISQGALFCIIKSVQKKEWQFYMAEPMPQMVYDSQMTLARFIRDAMNWQTGRSISIESDSGSDEWSKLIWDLIRQAENTAVNRGVIKYSSPSSLSDGFLHFLLNKQGINLSVQKNGINHSLDEDAGVSILFIDIDESSDGEVVQL